MLLRVIFQLDAEKDACVIRKPISVAGLGM